MDDTAAAAPVADTAAPAEVTPTLNEQMSAIWNKDRTDNTPPAPEEPEEVVEEQPKEEPAPEAEPAPAQLPTALKEAWANMSPEVQQAVQQSHEGLSQKLRDQGRLMQGLSPIKDALVEAAKENPAFASMQPAAIAQEMQKFNREVLQPLEKDPVGTLLKVAQERGVAEQLRAQLGGEQSQAGSQLQQMNALIRQQQQQIAQLTDPNYLREQVTNITQTNTVQNTVQDFVSSKEHWGTVEGVMPQMVEVMKTKMGEEASPTDILEAAYEHAVSMFIPQPEPKAEAETAPQPAVLEADPETTQAAIKAKSVNVQSKSSGKTRELPLNEQLRKIYANGQR